MGHGKIARGSEIFFFFFWPGKGGPPLENNQAIQRGEIVSKDAAMLTETVAQREGKSKKNKELAEFVKLKPKGPLEKKREEDGKKVQESETESEKSYRPLVMMVRVMVVMVVMETDGGCRMGLGRVLRVKVTITVRVIMHLISGRPGALPASSPVTLPTTNGVEMIIISILLFRKLISESLKHCTQSHTAKKEEPQNLAVTPKFDSRFHILGKRLRTEKEKVERKTEEEGGLP